ncbi:hypothetical protein [Bradyrhizobium lablabi]|uniref:hypothetical protein n=1 Tax=Bradyrhizobium lablabi TaxID=722472 RepID=UPI001BAB2B46|nr:hypothetical protein [Bradyrhizobium lablabi]MBR0693600.1 hypothetical protein [Bradyrhizobium lablabi]
MTLSPQAKFTEAYDKGTIGQKGAMKATLGLSCVIDSKLPRPVKVDAVMAAVEMLADFAVLEAVRKLRDCHRDTGAPLELIIAMLHDRTADSARKRELLFNNMMKLFADETAPAGG